jgi:hypothetical protein
MKQIHASKCIALRFSLEGEGWGEVAQAIYIHVSKCKNDKIKG